MVAEALPTDATTPVGAPGTVSTCGVTTALAMENGLHPLALHACTANSTLTPLTNPVIVAELGKTPLDAGFTVKSGIPELPPFASRVRTTKSVIAWPFGVGTQLTVAAFAVEIAVT